MSTDATPMPVSILAGDNLAVLPSLAADSFDAAVTDPPYGLEFMGKAWDCQVPGVEVWREVFRVMRPGAYLLAFFGTRTYHRGAVAVEDAGFEVLDQIAWLFGSGFPKHRSRLKPAMEPILVARKPAPKATPLNIDAARVPGEIDPAKYSSGISTSTEGWDRPWKHDEAARAARIERSAETLAAAQAHGRYPANVAHDGSDEVMEAFAAFGERAGGSRRPTGPRDDATNWRMPRPGCAASTGTADRFYYCAKASRSERDAGLEGMPLVPARRNGEQGQGALPKQTPRTAVPQRNTHPTVKPVALMRWLIRLVSRPGERVKDPFAGPGTTLVAAALEGRQAVGIEREAEYAEIARRRVAHAADPEPAEPTLFNVGA